MSSFTLRNMTKMAATAILAAAFAGSLAACETRVIHDGSPESKFNRPTNLNSIQRAGVTKVNPNDPMWH